MLFYFPFGVSASKIQGHHWPTKRFLCFRLSLNGGRWLTWISSSRSSIVSLRSTHSNTSHCDSVHRQATAYSPIRHLQARGHITITSYMPPIVCSARWAVNHQLPITTSRPPANQRSGQADPRVQLSAGAIPDAVWDEAHVVVLVLGLGFHWWRWGCCVGGRG